jgi:WD40 repeat protein
MAATGDRSGKIQVWDLQTSAVVWETETNAPVISLAFSQAGDQLAAGWCRSCTQQLYAAGIYEIGAERPAIALLSKFDIHSLAFSADGDFLAGGDMEGRIQLWDIQSQDPLGLAFAWDQTDTITALAISSDSRTLASGNQHGSLGLWDIDSRRQIGQNLRAGEAAVIGLLFAPDGLSLVSATQDGGLQRWDLDPQSWVERLCELADRDFMPGELEAYGVNPVCAESLPQATATSSP